MFRLDPNLLGQKIGNGGFGSVYAYDQWVVKKIKAKDLDSLLNSLPEIVLGFGFDHPCVLPAKGYSIEANPKVNGAFKLYLKLPRMEQNLRNEFRRRSERYSQEQVIRYFYSLVCGIEYLHSKGIYHRDIKPNNILLDHEGALKIADFGISKHVEAGDWDQALTGPQGAYCYLAPELRDKDRKNIKFDLLKADIWSLGLVMLELCAFDKKKDFNSILSQDLTQHLDEFLEGKYDTSLKALIQELLNLNPDQRPKIQEIKEKLESNFPRHLDQGFINLKNPPSLQTLKAYKEKIQDLMKEIGELKNKLKDEKGQLELGPRQLDDSSQIEAEPNRFQGLEHQYNDRIRELLENKNLAARASKQSASRIKLAPIFIVIAFLFGLFSKQTLGENQEKHQISNDSERSLLDLAPWKEAISNLNAHHGQSFIIEIIERKEYEPHLKIRTKQDVGNGDIKDEHFIPLLREIREMQERDSLTISGLEVTCTNCFQLTHEAFKYLRFAISNQSLNHLFLNFDACYQLNNVVFKEIVEAISTQSLNYLFLNFAWWDLTNEVFSYLREVLSTQPLSYLYMNFYGCSQLDNTAVTEVANAISTQPLNSLNLLFGGCPQMTDQALEVLSRVISTHSLEKFLLNFQNNPNITENGIDILANSLKNSLPKLRSLHLIFQ